MDGNATLNSLLNQFTDRNVKLRRNEKTIALGAWEPIVDEIVDDVKRRDRFDRFASLSKLPTGSYYERAKVGEPDEFDLMLVMDNLELDGDPYDSGEDDGLSEPPIGFTRVMIDRGEEVLWQQEQCANSRGMLNATKVKEVFARLVKEAIRVQQLESQFDSDIEVRSQGPAVTLKITRNGKEYSVDLTPAIKDNTWPDDAEEWSTRRRNGWPNLQLVQDICRGGSHLVAKQPKGQNLAEHEKGFLWRYSFSAAEKNLFLRGSYGEASSCRKQVLRILKALKDELHLQPLKSYHLKTILFYECEAKPQSEHWSSDCLGERFLGFLHRLENCLQQKSCPHYFIRDFNLFEPLDRQKCLELAGRVRRIRSQPEQELVRLLTQ